MALEKVEKEREITRRTISENIYLLLVAIVFLSIAIFFGLEICVSNSLPLGYISIFTSSLFSALTIILLSLVLKAKEKAEWKAVEDFVMKRIADMLFKVVGSATLWFTDNTEWQKKYKKELEETRFSEENHSVYCRLAVRYYSEHTVQISGHGQELFKNDPSSTVYEIAEEFRNQQERLEHMVSEYFSLLSPSCLNSLMSIQKDLDKVVDLCETAIFFAKSREEYHSKHLNYDLALERLSVSLQRMLREINILNEMGKGF
jgi:hypothetical protein